jgi:anti-anti-sigma regulatory factor
MRVWTRIDSNGTVTLVAEGTLNSAVVSDFERALEQLRQHEAPVVLDLTDMKLIDRPTLKYLIDLMQRDVRLVICPAYVEHWIYRESTRESNE